MSSIKAKICSLVIGCTAAASLTVSAISIISANNLINSDSAQIMNDVCHNATADFNAALSRIEQAVNTMAFYIDNNLDDFEKFKTSDEYVDEFTDNLQPLLRAAARNTDSIVCAYVRYNPEFTDPESGAFLSRNNLDAPFEELVPTDFSMYDPSDLEHVGWYYIPVNNGKPTWMDPYYNANINMNLVSYVIPLFKNGESVGIVGMDIDFSLLESLTDCENIYDDSTAILVSTDNDTILFGDGVKYGDKLSALDAGSANKELCGAIASRESSEDKLYGMTFNGKKMQASFRGLRNGMKLIAAASEKDINKSVNDLYLLSAVSSATIIVIGAGVAILVATGIVKPLRRLNGKVREIADGNLDVTVDVHTKDEVGTLANSFSVTVARLHEYIDYIDEISLILNKIAEGDLDFRLTRSYEGSFAEVKESLLNISQTLNGVMNDINDASKQVALKSSELASGAQSLAQTSTEQNDSVNELSSSIEKLTRDIAENNSSIHAALESVESAVSGIRESAKDMEEMKDAMNAISAASKEISSIVKTVDDIATQTNILAVNAAIEAARAGEAGKGFSVVSGEIQTLAAKTAGATKNISGLVQKVMKTVENGSGITEKTNESLNRVSGVSDGIEKALKDIAASSETQAESVERINVGIEQIGDAVQNNSATAEQSAAASEEMSSQAQMLHERVSIFKLKKQ